MSDALSTIQVAEILQVDPGMVRWWCRRGHLKAVRLGRDWFVRRADLDRFERPPRGRPPRKKSAP